MYVCKFSTKVEYGTRGQLVPTRLSPFRDPKCILPHFREFLTIFHIRHSVSMKSMYLARSSLRHLYVVRLRVVGLPCCVICSLLFA